MRRFGTSRSSSPIATLRPYTRGRGRVRRPCDRLGRGAPPRDSASLCPLLQRSENAPIVGQRRAILAPGSADRKHHVTGAPRRTASPIRASLSFRYTQPSPGGLLVTPLLEWHPLGP